MNTEDDDSSLTDDDKDSSNDTGSSNDSSSEEADNEEADSDDSDDSSDTSDSDDELCCPDIKIFSEGTILLEGLKLLGWTERRLNFKRRSVRRNHLQYRGMYGVPPIVTAQLCEDLQLTKVADAKVESSKLDLDKLHWALHWLYRYPTETERESTWQKCGNTIRDACWYYVAKIRALKTEKITWPGRNGHWKDDDKWVMTVDGTHLEILEPGDSDIPKDPAYFSFKHHAAGFNYEVGIDLFESRCIWLSGPWKAGEYNDRKMFKEKGLKRKLEQAGKMGIGDDGYTGYPRTISTANGMDSEEVSEFKSRARQRHEIYNGKLKHFDILSERFRCKSHPNDKFTVAEKLQMVFEAVNVLVQYKMEYGEPLFDI